MAETDRDAVSQAIGAVLFNASNFPERAQSRLLGQDMGPLRAKLTAAVLDALCPSTALDTELAEGAVLASCPNCDAQLATHDQTLTLEHAEDGAHVVNMRLA